jgi:hypothetical protein
LSDRVDAGWAAAGARASLVVVGGLMVRSGCSEPAAAAVETTGSIESIVEPG